MDVISLLNENAAEQQKKGDGSAKTTSTRNRTPWDAGGYSLPINTLSTALASSSSTRTTTPPQNTQNTQEHEESIDLPSSPRHKFTDSRSSLSSFTSSLQSTSHSRYSSSSSTVSSSLQQINYVGDIISPISGSKKSSVDFGSLTAMEGTRPRSGTQSWGTISPIDSMEALVLAAEKHSVSQRPLSARQLSNEDSSMSQTTEKPPSPSQIEFPARERPSSPSDAILIKRSALPILRLNTRSQDQKEVEEVEL
jgi:hypothetical protein